MHPFVLLRRLIRDDSGQDLLEYGLLAALIALVVFGAVTNAGISINDFWTRVATSMSSVA
jgi:pilus assembly protein Flp/PilA